MPFNLTSLVTGVENAATSLGHEAEQIVNTAAQTVTQKILPSVASNAIHVIQSDVQNANNAIASVSSAIGLQNRVNTLQNQPQTASTIQQTNVTQQQLNNATAKLQNTPFPISKQVTTQTVSHTVTPFGNPFVAMAQTDMARLSNLGVGQSSQSNTSAVQQPVVQSNDPKGQTTPDLMTALQNGLGGLGQEAQALIGGATQPTTSLVVPAVTGAVAGGAAGLASSGILSLLAPAHKVIHHRHRIRHMRHMYRTRRVRRHKRLR